MFWDKFGKLFNICYSSTRIMYERGVCKMLRSLLLSSVLLVSSMGMVHADSVGLVINGSVYTSDDITDEIESLAKFSGNLDAVHQNEFRTPAMNMLIVQYLIEDFSRLNNIALTEEEADNAWSMYLKGIDTTEDDYITELKEKDLSLEWVKAHVLRQTLTQKVGMLALGNKIRVTEDEVSDFKTKMLAVNAEHLIEAWILPPEHELANIQSIKEIKAEWAKTGLHPEIGELVQLGWAKSENLPGIFLEAIKDVQPGNLVGPVRSKHGYHILNYREVNQPEMPDDSVIEMMLMNQKFMQNFNVWVEDLKSKSSIIQKV